MSDDTDIGSYDIVIDGVQAHDIEQRESKRRALYEAAKTGRNFWIFERLAKKVEMVPRRRDKSSARPKRIRIDRPMRLSEVIKCLRAFCEEHGDVEVFADHHVEAVSDHG